MASPEDAIKENSLQKQELNFWEDLRKNGDEIDLRYARDLPDDTPKFILKLLARFEEDVAKFAFDRCSGLVLDAGCGNGNMLLRAIGKRSSGQMAGRGSFRTQVRYVGLDFSGNMLDMAASRVKEACLVRGCIDHLPFVDQTFDRIVSSGVITCLPSLHEAALSLAEFNRILKPGGVLVVDFFNSQSHFTRIRSRILKESINPPEYISFSSFKTMLEDSGFEVLAAKGFDYKPYQGYLFMSRWRPLIDPHFIQERFSQFIESKISPRLFGLNRFGYRIYLKCRKPIHY